MKYKEIDWERLKQRYAAWWDGSLTGPLIHIAAGPDSSVRLEPRPSEPEAVKKWFMSPDARMERELKAAMNSHYFGDAFPSIAIGRINLSLSLMYGCKARFTEHTVWVDHILEQGLENWQDKVIYNEDHELWQMTVGMAEKALELAGGDIAITQIGGCDGPLDNYSQMRGVEQALLDLADPENHDTILSIERMMLDGFKRYYFTLYDIIKTNPRGVCLWTAAQMVNGPAHCMQSDFSCMISPEMFNSLGRWYLEEQSAMFENTIYHLDGANALQHLPMLASIERLNCIQFIHNHSGGQPLTDIVEIVERIQATGKRVEVFSFMADDVVPFFRRLKSTKGLKLVVGAKTKEQAQDTMKAVQSLGVRLD